MRILFNNEVKNATITALTPNSNYSAPNLQSQFLRLKYKSLGISDTITVQFADNISANSFFYGYSNAVSMTIKIYSNASVLLETVAVDCTHDNGSAFFTRHDNVRYFTIEATSIATEDLYIGGIGFGISIDFPKPTATFDISLIDKAGKSNSGEGQTSYRYIEPIKKYDLSFEKVKRIPTFHDIVELFRDVGSGHIWIDITEQDHSVYKPMYCTTELYDKPNSEMHLVSFSINFTEAR